MAYLATLQLLIDAESESAATVLSSDIASQLQADGQVLDWSVKDARAVNDTVRDSIANETYVSGECFGEYIVVSTTKRPQDASFWSNTYGWTAYDLATGWDFPGFHVVVACSLTRTNEQRSSSLPAHSSNEFPHLRDSLV